MMTDEQLAFFRDLCAPFDPAQVKELNRGGRTLSYVKAKAVMNRLDDVAGPDGWYPEYRATDRGYTCRLFIRVPGLDGPGDLVWLWKEDGGGTEGMVRTDRTGQKEPDVDNDEKSAYTNAFRRAAATWGIARYLWQDGVPGYLEDLVGAEQAPQRAPARGTQRPPARPASAARAPAAQAAARPARAPARSAAATARAPQNGPAGDGFTGLELPRSARAVFPWMKRLEEHFGGEIIAESNAYAKEQGYPWKAAEWDEYQTEDVVWHLVDVVKEWDSYRGEFDDLEDPRPGE
jgi:hypothetical protein